MPSITPFQGKIYQLLREIPRGCVTTYGLLGQAAGCSSAQAVGQALKKNPFAPEVPCHRVIKSDLTIGGYSGRVEGSQVVRKMELLKNEGVLFQQGKLVHAEQIYRFQL